MVTIKPYQPAFRAALVDVFKSNMPLYFAEEELPLFEAFLDDDVDMAQRPYWMLLREGQILGCGGIGVNEPTKFTTERHVIMCWGMVHRELHKQGFGKLLLEHRIEQAKLYFPGLKIALGTTQHSAPFFEKYGFKTVYYEKDHWAPGMDLYHMELLQ